MGLDGKRIEVYLTQLQRRYKIIMYLTKITIALTNENFVLKFAKLSICMGTNFCGVR